MVFFLHLKDEASKVIISFIKKTQVNLQLQVQRIRTDNGTEFKNKTLAKFFNEDVGKHKVKGDIGVFVGYSKESAAFRIYNKRTRKIHESVNVNFDEISEMASKQFSLEPGLSNLNETGKSSNPSVSNVDEAAKKDLEDLFQDFYSEYFDSSKIMKSLTTNVETPINEEVFHESIPINMVPNGDEASTSHNVFDERLEEAYFDTTLRDADWVSAMQEELDQFARLKDFTVFQMDIKMAFLNGILKEEVYVGQPLAPTPMVEQAKLKLDLVRKLVDHTDYRSMIGSLMYLTSSRPDIMFATCLWYLKDFGFDLTVYLDADHAGCHLDREMLWIRTQLTDYGFFYGNVPIYCDSKSAIAISCNPIQVASKKVKLAFENADFEFGSRVDTFKDKDVLISPKETKPTPSPIGPTGLETYKNVSQEIRDQLSTEAEVVQIILTGIDNDIYSTVDACPNACEMWKAIERNKGKAIINSPQPIYDQEPSMVPEDDETSKDKEIDKLMALISLSFKKIYKTANNNLQTSSNTSRANQDNSLRINRNAGYENQRIGNVVGAREIVEDHELKAHYMYMAQLQEVSPDAADSGPIFDDEPLQKNDDDNDLAKERELLASLIEKLKREIDENKNRNKLLETSNKDLIEKLKGEIEDFKNKNKSLESSNNFFKEANNKLSETNNLLYADYKKSEAELARRNSKEYASQMELECTKINVINEHNYEFVQVRLADAVQ
nr:hypothetical protein [Tanacetum cinerariifolium]